MHLVPVPSLISSNSTLDIHSVFGNALESPQLSAITAILTPASDFSIYSSAEIVEDWEENAILNQSLCFLGSLENARERSDNLPPIFITPVSSEHGSALLLANSVDMDSTVFVVYAVHKVIGFLVPLHHAYYLFWRTIFLPQLHRLHSIQLCRHI